MKKILTMVVLIYFVFLLGAKPCYGVQAGLVDFALKSANTCCVKVNIRYLSSF